MKSWRSLLAAGIATGAAAAVFSLTAGTAYADDWSLVGGGSGGEQECITQAEEYLAEPYVDYTEYKCEMDGDNWTFWAR